MTLREKTRRDGNFLYRRKQSAFPVLYRLYKYCSADGDAMQIIDFIRDFQTLIAAFLALLGASLFLIATKAQIRAGEKQRADDRLADIKSLAAILAVEAEMSLRSAGYVAAMLYSNPRTAINQDFNFQVFRENLSSLGKLPGALPQQVMYCFNKVTELQTLVRERASALGQLGSEEEMGENLERATVSTVDIASSAIVELAILTPWLERVAETGAALSLEQAMHQIKPAFDRVNPLGRQLAAVKLQELKPPRTEGNDQESAEQSAPADADKPRR